MVAARRRLFVLTISSGLLASVVFFFGFHILAGDRGFLARPELDRKIVLAEERLSLLEKHRAFLSHRIHLLQADSLDADMLAETARAELGLYSPNDVIISIDLSKLKFSDIVEEFTIN